MHAVSTIRRETVKKVMDVVVSATSRPKRSLNTGRRSQSIIRRHYARIVSVQIQGRSGRFWRI